MTTVEDSHEPDSQACVGAYRLAWATTLVVLIAATWPLWTPLRDVPRVALAPALACAPPVFDWVLLLLLAYGFFLSLRTGSRGAIAIASLSLLALMAPDQVRWQPWAYHGLIAGAVLTLGRGTRPLALLRWVTVSVYVYAAVAKLDATYAATLGQQVLETLASGAGGPVEEMDLSTRHAMALAPPIFELLVGCALGASIFYAPLRKPACVIAVVMHAMTIGVLGPWALGHSLGVLLWNTGFAWQTVTLFWSQPQPIEKVGAVAKGLSGKLAIGLISLVLIAPLTASWGGWDRWPSWGLYAPAGERAAVFVHQGAVDRLPESLIEQIEQESVDAVDPWRRLRIDRWVLSETGAPIYPQNRVRLALAAAIAERYALAERIRVVLDSRADRYTGERSTQTLDGLEPIQSEAVWLGTDPTITWTE